MSSYGRVTRALARVANNRRVYGRLYGRKITFPVLLVYQESAELNLPIHCSGYRVTSVSKEMCFLPCFPLRIFAMCIEKT